MNYKVIFGSLGTVLCVEACCMLPSFFIALIYGQGDAMAFLLSAAILTAIGLLLRRIKPVSVNLYARDGFAIVAFGWLLVALFGALPFLLSGAIPSVIDAVFESVSGFTTTGASVVSNVEALPKGILFHRSFSQWVGGMGILILMLALLPSVKANAVHIMKAETPGPVPEKFVPKMGQFAKILYIIYVVLTAAQVIFLLSGGMSLYDSLIHAFSTVSTGGFSGKNASVAAFGNVYIEVVITVFTLLCGVNFTLYYLIIKGKIKSAFKDEEVRFYLLTVVISTALVVLNTVGSVYDTVGEALRYAAFQVGALVTTTGFTTANYNLWPMFSQCVLLLLMFIGASAGSTSGGIKCIRILILFKIVKREIYKIIHPNSVHTVKINKKAVDERALSGISAFFFIYICIFAAAVLVVSLDGKDFLTTVTAVISSINNVGPGLGAVGPEGNYAGFSALSKAVLSLCMIVGRLEIYPILLLLFPTFWKKVNI